MRRILRQWKRLVQERSALCKLVFGTKKCSLCVSSMILSGVLLLFFNIFNIIEFLSHLLFSLTLSVGKDKMSLELLRTLLAGGV